MKLFTKIVAWLSAYCDDVDSISQQRACVLLQVSGIAFVLSILVGLYALFYLRLPIAAVDAWSCFVIAVAALVSGVLMLRGSYTAAAHAAVALSFVGLWAQVFDRAGMMTTQSAVTYVVALLCLPALLLGRGWTLLYGLITVILAGITSAHLAMVHHFTPLDAAAYAIDIVAAAIFIIAVTGLISRMYESALVRVRGLLAAQVQHVAEVTQLSESLRESEAHKRQFYRDTIYSVTSGKLSIYEEADMQPYLQSPDLFLHITEATALTEARQRITDFSRQHGVAGVELDTFTIAVGEAMTNSIKHASEGEVCAGTDEGSVWVAVSDRGPGIDSLILPRAVLLAGFSTKPSLGLGYTIMLDVADRILLKTSETGTTVMLIKYVGEGAHQPPPVFRSVLQTGL